MMVRSGIGLLCAWLLATASAVAAADTKPAPMPDVTLFQIGEPDGSGAEFGLTKEKWPEYAKKYRKPVVFTVGKSKPAAWPYIHPGNHDSWAGGTAHTFTINFRVETLPDRPLFLIVGQAEACTPAQMAVAVNGQPVASRRVPAGSGSGSGDPFDHGKPGTMVFPLPAGAVRAGDNSIALTLSDGSWIIYDYVRLGTDAQPPKITTEVEGLLEKFLAGPMAGVEDVVFTVRKIIGEHWYANFSYYAWDDGQSELGDSRKLYRDGGRLCRLNLRTRKVTTLLDDPAGGVRDPQVHYDGKKMVFSYRKGGTDYYHLYEINADGSGLRQLTDGPWDDIEPTYVPDGGIVFVSSRAKRWVNCWLTKVATLHRCDANGGNIRAISSNNEHDNTPWPLPDGRLLYTRWEYVDRSQVHYHHLWSANPDGTGQTVYFGNLVPGILMIDAKPVPGSEKIVASFSPGHGRTEHEGRITLVDPAAGPDEPAFARPISRADNFRDPWAFSEDCFLAARGSALVVMDGLGHTQEILTLTKEETLDKCWVHEPRPLMPRPREERIPSRVAADQPAGRMVLANVYDGRNMEGVKPGEIKKLLVLESLPKPINYTGGMDPLTYGGSFTLERVLGTVPVEPDGSAHFEVPALRSVFFVALDKDDLSVKRMQSFSTVQPGETLSCVGCHEHRTRAPLTASASTLAALRRPPSRIEPVAGVPDIYDFPRDIQPVLDALCVKCHGYEKAAEGGPRAAKLILSGDRGPMFSHSYYTMTVAGLFSDGRNQPVSNYAPRTLGSGASKILTMLDGSHHGVKASDHQKTLLRLWIETGAPYPGTYAALGSGMVGGYQANKLINVDTDWPTTQAGAEVMDRRCMACHKELSRLLPRSLSDERGLSFWKPEMNDPRLKTSRHIVFNLTRPEKSVVLLAPLAEAAGGWGLCRDPKTGQPVTVFTDTNEPDYRKLLAMCAAGKESLDKIKRFDMPGFQPRIEWVREMKRYGVLAANVNPAGPLDVYAIERDYWKSLWWLPPR